MNNNKISQNLYLQGVTVEEFKELISDLLEQRFDLTNAKLVKDDKIPGIGLEFDSHSLRNQCHYLTRGEVAKQLQISLPTLHNYIKQGFLKSYRIGGKVRFKANEIEKSLTERNFTSVNRKGGRNHA